MEPGGLMPHSQGSPIILILSRIKPIPPIGTYFFKNYSNIAIHACMFTRAYGPRVFAKALQRSNLTP